MRRRLHLIALVLFVLTLGYDLVVWGALPRLPGIGAQIAVSARHEAPLATTYIVLGAPLDAALPALQAFGERRLAAAFAEGFAELDEEATAAMDVIFNSTWNAQHRWLKLMYWAPPLLLVLTLLLWSRKPKQVRMFSGRR
ncbi:MAG: hypothetical protein J0H15_05925 [Xanthomonadales bacterium]|nr:hypothetical protein [Xanthomonadales bacterium]